MKTSHIARDFGIDLREFEQWLPGSGYPYKSGLTSTTVPDEVNVEALVGDFKQHLADQAARLAEQQEQLAREREVEAQAAQVKQQALASMLITSGFNFDGHTITKYSGYISGDDAVSMDRPRHGWLGGVDGEVGTDLLVSLARIRRNALHELKEAAYALGCNAVIGVDFDYITMDPETVNNSGGTLYLPFLFAVTANGNAVVIEKNE